MAQKLDAEDCDGWDKADNEPGAILGLTHPFSFGGDEE